MLAAVLAGAERVVHPADVAGQVAAAVGDAELQARVGVQHSAEDQVTDSDGRFQRVADQVVEIVLRQALAVGEAQRVHEDEDAQLFGRREEWAVLRIGQLAAVDVGRDLDAPEAELAGQATQLPDRQFRRLQRYRPHADQPLGMAGDRLGHAVVDHARGLETQLGLGPIVVLAGGGGDRLDVDASGVHVGDMLVDRRQLLAHLGELLPVHLIGGGRREAVDRDRRRILVGTHHRVGRRDGQVAVDVYDLVAAVSPGHRSARTAPGAVGSATEDAALAHAFSSAGVTRPLQGPKPMET